jgi:hypothetical protein
MSISGSCHCGRIRYTLDEDPAGAMACNRFALQGSRDDIAVYTFGSHNIRHQFCKTCGCAPFGEGTGPGGEAMVAVNLRCADIDLDAIKVDEFDGASL